MKRNNLSDIKIALVNINNEIKIVKDKLENIQQRQEEHTKLLSGNGGIGLCERMRRTETELQTVKQQSKQNFFWIIGIAAVIATAGSISIDKIISIIRNILR